MWTRVYCPRPFLEIQGDYKMTVSETTVVPVRNMVDHTVSYIVEDLNVTRRFDPFETKEISIAELRALNYKRGGRILLRDYLSVKNDEFRKEIGIAEDAIEYDYRQADIDKILLEEPVEVLEDTLDFGPAGIKELVQSRAVKLKIPDINKRQVIYDFTGVDINKQIKLKEDQEEAMEAEGVQAVEAVPTEVRRQRRVAVHKD